MVAVARFHDDPERLRRLMDQNSAMIDYSVSSEGDGAVLAYIHSWPPDPIREIILLLRRHEVFFESFEFIREDTARATMVGETNKMLQQALAAIPEEVDATVDRIGVYSPDRNDFRAALTERQQEILDIAMELGYYENPRRATHGEIAERAGIDASTVSEHMRKIEACAFAFLAG